MRPMRPFFLAFAIALLSASATAQTALLEARPKAQHVSIKAGGDTTAAPGSAVRLWVDVTPRPNVHVYAVGAKDFTPVTIVPTPSEGVSFLKPTFPAPALQATLGAPLPVPAYATTFRISQPARIGERTPRGTTLTLSAAINYQACDDRVCYPVLSAPVLWTVVVK